MIRRCLDSCLNQSFADLEVIVVDDASTDHTSEVLAGVKDHRLICVKHPENLGMHPARNTGIKKARGEWVITLDSDWELLPNTLEMLHAVTITVAEEIVAVRSRLRWDTGRITPAFVPDEPIDYEGRIKWVEVEGGSDALMCVPRHVFDKVIYEPIRRATDNLFQLNLALQGRILYLDDILAYEHNDAPNSETRGKSPALLDLIQKNALDHLWEYEQILHLHGEALKRWGPRQYHACYRAAALECFYLGQRWRGCKYMARYLRFQPLDVYAWFILGLGLLGPSATLHGKLAKRKLGV